MAVGLHPVDQRAGRTRRRLGLEAPQPEVLLVDVEPAALVVGDAALGLRRHPELAEEPELQQAVAIGVVDAVLPDPLGSRDEVDVEVAAGLAVIEAQPLAERRRDRAVIVRRQLEHAGRGIDREQPQSVVVDHRDVAALAPDRDVLADVDVAPEGRCRRDPLPAGAVEVVRLERALPVVAEDAVDAWGDHEWEQRKHEDGHPSPPGSTASTGHDHEECRSPPPADTTPTG